jgi:hypothetical protein
MTARWKKPTRSAGANNCVELSNLGAIRDSKNPAGPVLAVELDTFLTAIKTGRLSR